MYRDPLIFLLSLPLLLQQNPTLDWRNRLPGETEQTNDEVRMAFVSRIFQFLLVLLLSRINMQPQEYSNYLTQIVKCIEK